MMVLMSFGSRTESAEWSAEPSLSVRGEYNSNLLLTSLPHDDTWGHWTSPGLKFAGSTENLEVSGKVAADFVSYYGGIDRSLTNLYFPLALRYQAARETFAFDGGFTRDNTLMGELRQTGVVLSFTQRNLWNLTPSWTHNFTERFAVQAGYQYSDATYEDGVRLGLVDYTIHGGSAGLLYQPAERDQVRLTGSYTNFHAPQAGDLRSQIYSGQVSFTHNFTESLSVTVGGGPSLVRSAVGPSPFRQSDVQTVWVGNATLRKRWEDAVVQLDLAREIFPSGFGLLLQTDRAGLSLSKDLSEAWTVSFSGSVLLASSIATVAGGVSFPQNRYINVTPQVTYKPSQYWAISAAYGYSHRQVESFNETAFGNLATVTVTYFPVKWTVGR